jgi:diguanylate cyclase (GGDEF)-like protein
MSFAGQMFAAVGLCLVVTAGLAICAARSLGEGRGTIYRLELIGMLCLGAIFSMGVVLWAVRRLMVDPLREIEAGLSSLLNPPATATPDARPMPSRELRQIRQTLDHVVGHVTTARRNFEDAQRAMSERQATVDRLLDFSQTIQGAGAVAQVFASLAHYLKNELKLAGVAIISNEPEQTPAMQVRAAWPETLVRANSIGDLEAAACPCLRQHLPKSFALGGSPVRCAVDACLTMGAEYPAYCIPFNVGGRMQVVVHMLLPLGCGKGIAARDCSSCAGRSSGCVQPGLNVDGWTEDRKQVAQTYVNTAVSTLISLHLLAEAEKQSMTDGLTGLYNRRSLDSLLQREVALAERHGVPLSLVMIDMDRFKQINDAHGHAAGDHLLKAFADCVRITLRKTDLAFRFGGDEFVIALPQTGVAQAVRVVNKLRQAFGAVDFSHAIARMEQQPTLSIGVVERSVPHNVVTLQNLLAAADVALYDAKAANRNCVKVYQPPVAEAAAKAEPPPKAA